MRDPTETPFVCLSECPILENERTHPHTRTPTPTHKGQMRAWNFASRSVAGPVMHEICAFRAASRPPAGPAARTRSKPNGLATSVPADCIVGADPTDSMAEHLDKPRGSRVAAQAIDSNGLIFLTARQWKKHRGQGAARLARFRVAEQSGVTSLCRRVGQNSACYVSRKVTNQDKIGD